MPNRVLGKGEQTPRDHYIATSHRLKQSRNLVFVAILSQKNAPGLALYTDLHTTAQHVDQESRGVNALRPMEGP